MSKTWLFILLFIFSISSETSKANVDSTKLKFDFYYSIDRSYRRLLSEDVYYDELVNRRNQTEIPKTTYSYGLTINKRLNQRFRLLFGISFTERGYRTIELTEIRISKVNGVNLKIDTVTYRNNYSLKFAEFPIGINAPIIYRRRFSLSTSFGGIIGFNYKSSVNRVHLYDKAGRMLLGCLFYPNLEFYLSRNLSFSLFPNVSFFKTSFRRGFGVKENLFKYGLGLSINLKK